MAERWVINASPVILLAKAEVIQFIPQICEHLVIPAGVVQEVRRGKVSDAGFAWLQGEGARFLAEPPATPPEILEWDLGLGETQVLACAMSRPGFTAVLDDLQARRCAEKIDPRNSTCGGKV